MVHIFLTMRNLLCFKWLWVSFQKNDLVRSRGVNKKGFNSNWPWSKRVPLDPSRTNMLFRKKKEVCLQTPSLPQTTYIAYGKGKEMKILILFFQWSKCIPSNLKGTPMAFNGIFEGFYVPHSSQMREKIPFWPKQPFGTYIRTEVYITFNSYLSIIIIPFR